MRFVIVTALLTLVAGTASAQQGATTNTPASQPEKKICKVDPEDTESRIRRRICKTESEWKLGKKPSGAQPRTN